ncbi:trafficking protein particle complex subunit 10 isoform X2 [Lepisosteus oculatus]|uniref:trafficking protein particle complex subunit 10 isoform X2 n=1 Tax=Lepisosteus oculatus TaxID=7918 RepID=UPI000740279D|nr:PREDICTED: trafficking protein particle complex subunit 10 isoform X1 [Lepisosteus oculatus]
MESHEEKPIIYTMENKPIVTCSGDQSLFTSLYHCLAQQLPREPMEWRRSYGRPPKMIHLEANFVQFKEDLLPKEGNKALLTFPFLHIYWTDCCDTEVYKASVKDDIVRWQNTLKTYNTADWLIVVVESDAKKKNKTNILPRTSIVDKIRNDFCNKQSDRCVVLSDPLKDSSRSQESWSAFLTKLRTLLLMSFTKNLGKFEDDMRTLREKRTDPGWSFCEYFMVQEELAFVFEMLQQFEDALVQYDELDALFTQYVVNFGAGDGANWLGSFCQPVQNWNGLVLRKPIDMEKRDLIQRSQASLLDLRSYLFSRQCTLLIFLQRPWEVTQRALELLHNCVQELQLLEVSVLQGSLDCWVFLSCLEVLQRIEGCCDRAQLEANISHTVGLWTYATEKLKSLGCLCGLVSENGPNSEDLNRTVDLLAGLGTERPETASSLQSPYKKLKEALSSVEAFEKHYLELSHAAMEMYKTIGRIRSAKLLGKSLAEFYMRKSDPKKAEALFQDSLKTYLAEGWALPVTHTRKQIAECQKLLGQTESYLQTSSLLASDGNLSDEERKHFCQEILNFACQQSDNQVQKVVLGMSSLAQLQHLLFTPTSAVVHVGGQVALELSLHSNMPMPVHLEQLAVSVHFSIERSSIRETGDVLGKQRTGGVNSGIIHFPGELPAGCLPRTSPPVLELDEMHDRSPSDNALNSSGVVCKNVHLLLRRRESVSSLETPSGVAVEDSAQILRTNDVLLLPGRNKILFTAPSREPGTYTLRQLRATVGQVRFVQHHIYPIVQYEVYSQEPQLKVEPLTDVLLAGVPQRVKFTIVTGHYSIKKGDALQLSNNDSMPILHSTDCTATIMSNTGERVGENGLSIQSSEKVTSITLPLTSTYHMVEFELEVMCHIPSILPKATDSDRLTNGELYQRAKSKCKTESHMASIDQKMSIDCPWSIYSTLVALTFYIPFKSQHSLLSAGKRFNSIPLTFPFPLNVDSMTATFSSDQPFRKYIQVCMQNMSDMNFCLLNHCLTEKQKNTTLELVPVNIKPQQNVYSKQSVFCLWEVKWTTEPPSCLQCVFTISFSPMTEEEPSFQPYSYEFQLDNISTLYSVKAQIVPALGVQHCRTGSLCSLNVSLTRLSDLIEQNSDEGLTESDVLCTTKVMYEVADNSSNWAVCGKSSGVISMPVMASATHKVQMEVMPLFAGNLPFPSIRVFKYLPHHAAHSIQPDTDSWIENDNLSIDKSLEEQGDNSSIRSRTSTHSIGNEHKGLPIPRLEPFSSGQVFNSSSGQQVLVMPSKDDHVLEVNIT